MIHYTISAVCDRIGNPEPDRTVFGKKLDRTGTELTGFCCWGTPLTELTGFCRIFMVICKNSDMLNTLIITIMPSVFS